MEVKPKRRSGTEKRRTPKTIAARVTLAQKAEVKAIADRAGISESALLLQAVLGIKPPRAARRPTVNQKLVVRFLGLLGNVASNINQIARVGNMTGEIRNTDSLDNALRAIDEMRSGCMEALGREKGRGGD